jgi:hypothetical protein
LSTEIVNAIHVPLGDRQCGGIDDDRLALVELHQRAGVVGIGVDMNDASRLDKGELVGFHFLVAGKQQEVGERGA